jgi:Protein of unknown function (DUF664)
MTCSDYWWEPPLAGTEPEHLIGSLDRLRTTFRWKAGDLGAAGMRTRIAGSALTIGGLLKHLAAGEDYMFTTKLRGEPISASWDATGWAGSNDWGVHLRRQRHPATALRALGWRRLGARRLDRCRRTVGPRHLHFQPRPSGLQPRD